ncbi:DTW-domain-containing protein [Rhizopus microsporus var. microsporus]|uniref:tRNA-uridine aminocarboxypropyltransferase 1 n=2 Tax=Rhizopus microsporus TaxID=58291 RepID=A0A2G4SR95_RHIZD|nr:DTW-domain-containing protein [Rhizopus microsporus ATCC 52813]ORE06419.1 DTW-domain-containing protein [Rhizopus microsporus var. microsporus]PHZ11291.1 DTW-domain-containing protein [Rhizopus microsporus ATCC 52813]
MAIIDIEQVEELRKNSPFSQLKIQDDIELYKKTDRYTCPACNKRMKYFCYYCYRVLGMNRSDVPFVKLPMPIDIIKHESELDGKTTALHARVIADQDVSVYNWKKMPQYEQPERILMLFPGSDAKKLSEIPRDSFDKFIVIDGTWKQAKTIVRETPLLQKVQKVTIEPRQTFFWRYQDISVNYLSTIEAIYYLYVEYAQQFELNGAYDGRYDNLLFYYKHLYDLIQYSYLKGEHKDRKFCWRHKENYIKKSSQ